MSAQQKEKQNLCMSAHEEFEKIAVMIDSGASEIVASVEKFEFVSSWQASRGRRPRWSEIHSSRRRSRHGELGQVTDKIMRSVSRLVESGHPVVFQRPRAGSYIQNDSNGNRTYLRQQHRSYYLDLQVRRNHGAYEQQHASCFHRRSMLRMRSLQDRKMTVDM